MPRSFDMATEYEGSVEQVHRAFREERYWMARLTESGADAYSLDRLILGDDGGIDIVTTQKILASRLPGVVQQFHGGRVIHRQRRRLTRAIQSMPVECIPDHVVQQHLIARNTHQRRTGQIRIQLQQRLYQTLQRLCAEQGFQGQGHLEGLIDARH